jgi:hypothetical protein
MSQWISRALSLLMSLSAFPYFFGIGPVDSGSSSKNFRWDEDIIWTVEVSFTLISISWTQLMACQCSPLTCPLRRRCFPWFSTIPLSRVSGKCKYEIYIFQISNNIEIVHSLSNWKSLALSSANPRRTKFYLRVALHSIILVILKWSYHYRGILEHFL